MDIRINIRPLSDAQARKALPFLQAQGLEGLHKDSIVVIPDADALYAVLAAYQRENSLPPAFVLEEGA